MGNTDDCSARLLCLFITASCHASAVAGASTARLCTVYSVKTHTHTHTHQRSGYIVSIVHALSFCNMLRIIADPMHIWITNTLPDLTLPSPALVKPRDARTQLHAGQAHLELSSGQIGVLPSWPSYHSRRFEPMVADHHNA